MGDLRGPGPNIAMSYERRNSTVQIAMGDPFSDLLKCGQSAIAATAGAATDPYLPEVICRISQLQALAKDRTPLQAMFGKKPTVPVPNCVKTPAGIKGGLGLERAIKPIRGLVYVNQHPSTVWLGLTALFGIPLLAGYLLGKAK